ncbi:PREDICTED: protein PHYTOCHROME KINASE SUBSTRATE 3-like [Nicotiana attenuata]|uniref:Protein phytochrome kinase substrate 1 n=1 Tax=Nicotiana attenuata TaxID=49451 RepID=A0A1J6IJV8_NICAT|nr:PREDICTED: protein PHYTOCHROME KINASE SUBSTRATE 3-like [Nicotiana attenuata]OIT05010.1 protein phytochrome kinase substrate 1 [Nicotiana attenuata]
MAADDNTTSLRIASFSCYLSNPEESFVQKIGGAVESALISHPETPFSLTAVKAAKAAAAKPSLNSNQDNLANLRMESFSYLKTKEENFAFKNSAAPVQDPTIAFVFPQQVKQLERNKSKDGEISIFGADKYFNMDLDYGAAPLPPDGVMKYKTTDPPNLKPNVQSGTPSICSEASSWNSQNALLQNIRRNGCQTKQKKITRRRFLDSISCQPCSDKKAVYVDESIGHAISQPGPKHGVGPFALSLAQGQSIEEQRKSLEVFGSGKMGKGDIAVNLERKLSMLTWDAIPKAQNLPTTTNGSSTVCDDMASDASSDLFEIENISSSGYGLVNTQTSGDCMSSSCMSPTTQYAPSEVSIEWSVVTASAADYSSIISDYDEKNFCISGNINSRYATDKTTKNKNTVGKEVQKTCPSTGLLGCKSHKAVNVAETVHKTSEKANQR